MHTSGAIVAASKSGRWLGHLRPYRREAVREQVEPTVSALQPEPSRMPTLPLYPTRIEALRETIGRLKALRL